MIKRTVILSLFVLSAFSICQELYAQIDPDPDTTIITESNIEIGTDNIQEFDDPFIDHDPKKASLLSAVLPGLGQAYNKQYWKIPIIYGSAALIGYFIDFNHTQYINFRRELFENVDGDDVMSSVPLSTEALRRGTDEWRRNRDLLYFVSGFLYLLNVVDAHVSAHLKSFEVNTDLSLKIEPGMDQLTMVGSGIVNYPTVSIRLVF
ncbi:MAG: DUF5683 domain-containing protein [Bacteroidota bacterium]